MAILVKRLSVAVLAGVALGALVSPAPAQPRIMPSSAGFVNPMWRVGPQAIPLNQAAYNTAVFGNAMSRIPPWLYGYNPYPQVQNFGPVFNPMLNSGVGVPFPAATLTSTGLGYNSLYNNYLNGYGGYGYGGYGWGGYYPGMFDMGLGYTLQGAASAINAQGQFNIQNQQAKLIQQQVEQAKIDTRRRQFDEWLYEKANTPTVEDMRELRDRTELRRAMRNPPLTEILNGSSLEAVYQDLLKKQPQWTRGPAQTIDESILKHINFTTKSGGNVGLLKRLRDGEPLPWPAVLKQEAYSKLVEGINKRMQEAVREAESRGTVDAGRLNNMQDDHKALQGMVAANINDMAPSENVAARRFLTQLEGAINALQAPDIQEHLTGKFAAQGKTMQQLLQDMQSKGLSIGPATNGDEAAYIALHNYLVGFNMALGAQP